MVEIGQAEITRDRERIGFVNAEAQRKGEADPGRQKSKDDDPGAPVRDVERRRFVISRSQGAWSRRLLVLAAGTKVGGVGAEGSPAEAFRAPASRSAKRPHDHRKT